MKIIKRVLGQRALTAACLLVISASCACQKKSDAPAPAATVASPPPAVSIAPLAEAVAAASGSAASAAPAMLGSVKRFPEKEQVATGAVKVTLDNSPVYDEPDATTPSVASLSKDLFVFRLATLGADWLLVDFPSGLGKLAPGWIETKSVSAEVHAAVTHATVASQSKSAIVPGSAKPIASAPALKVTSPSVPAAPVVAAPPVMAPAPVATTPPTATVRVRPSLIAPPKH
jgi:hypothetical protein